MRRFIYLVFSVGLVGLFLVGQLAGAAVAAPLKGFTSTPTFTPTPGAGPSATPPPGPILVDPHITKEADVQLAQIGDVVHFTIIASNPNAIAVMSVLVEDTLPLELDFINATTTQGTMFFEAATNKFSFDIGTLAAGQSVTMVITTRVNERGRPQQELRNTAILWVSGVDKGEASATVTLIPGTIPGTGLPPGPSPLLISVLSILAALAIPALWLGWRRWRRA